MGPVPGSKRTFRSRSVKSQPSKLAAEVELPVLCSEAAGSSAEPWGSRSTNSAWKAAIPSTSNNHTKTYTRKEPASGAKAGCCEAIADAGIIKETKLNLKI